MCAACKYTNADCSELNFRAMPHLARIEGEEETVVVVRCGNFERGEDEA
jgi:hypothetical protein